MTSFYANASIGVVVDLQRSTLSYRLFQFVFRFQLNNMSRQDGLISILRGFKKKRVASFSEKLNFKKYKINGNGLLDTNG
jgi:hypothetical protein